MVKLTSSVNAGLNHPADTVTGVVIAPNVLRGGRVSGKVLRADHDIIRISFEFLTFEGRTYHLNSEVTSVVSSKGMMGQDDFNQRIRIEGGNIIAYGVTTALNEGAEVRFVGWEK